ncbi:MAG: hypothetical protein GY730_01010, partial [bacterium]|nr:hypothetical protein [bacterium]
VIEQNIDLILNNQKINVFSTIPSQIKELSIGFIISNNLIASLNEIKEIEISNKTVILSTYTENIKPAQLNTNIQKINTPLSSDLISQLMRNFKEKALLFKDTSVSHSAALCNGQNILYFSEDINRLNAIDKAIGSAILNNDSGKDKVLITSGKIDKKTVEKAVNMSIPVIISRTGPTDQAYCLAQNKNITIIGFARNKVFNIYNNESCIKAP